MGRVSGPGLDQNHREIGPFARRKKTNKLNRFLARRALSSFWTKLCPFFCETPLWPFVRAKLCPIFRECTRTVLLVRARLCPFFFEVVSRSHRERHCMCRSGSVNCYISSSSCYKKQISKTSGNFPRNLKSIFPWLFSRIFGLRFKPGVQPTSELKSIALYTKTAVFNITLK